MKAELLESKSSGHSISSRCSGFCLPKEALIMRHPCPAVAYKDGAYLTGLVLDQASFPLKVLLDDLPTFLIMG